MIEAGWIDYSGALTATAIGAWAVFLVVGAIGHELMHVVTFVVFGEMPTVRFAPEYLGVAVQPTGAPPRWQVAIAALSPTLWLLVGGYGITTQLATPVNWRLAVLAGLFAVGAMPSPGDLYTALMYHPDGVQGVAVDG